MGPLSRPGDFQLGTLGISDMKLLLPWNWTLNSITHNHRWWHQQGWQMQFLKSEAWQECERKINASWELLMASFVGCHLKMIGNAFEQIWLSWGEKILSLMCFVIRVHGKFQHLSSSSFLRVWPSTKPETVSRDRNLVSHSTNTFSDLEDCSQDYLPGGPER